MKKQKKSRIVLKTIRESKEILLELDDSTDSVSSTDSSFNGIETFLEQLKQEMTDELPKGTQKRVLTELTIILVGFFLSKLLEPATQLFLELLGKAVYFGGQFFGGTSLPIFYVRQDSLK